MKDSQLNMETSNDITGEAYGKRQEREYNPCPTMAEAFKGLEAYFLEIRKSSAE